MLTSEEILSNNPFTLDVNGDDRTFLVEKVGPRYAVHVFVDGRQHLIGWLSSGLDFTSTNTRISIIPAVIAFGWFVRCINLNCKSEIHFSKE